MHSTDFECLLYFRHCCKSWGYNKGKNRCNPCSHWVYNLLWKYKWWLDSNEDKFISDNYECYEEHKTVRKERLWWGGRIWHYASLNGGHLSWASHCEESAVWRQGRTFSQWTPDLLYRSSNVVRSLRGLSGSDICIENKLFTYSTYLFEMEQADTKSRRLGVVG